MKLCVTVSNKHIITSKHLDVRVVRRRNCSTGVACWRYMGGRYGRNETWPYSENIFIFNQSEMKPIKIRHQPVVVKLLSYLRTCSAGVRPAWSAWRYEMVGAASNIPTRNFARIAWARKPAPIKWAYIHEILMCEANWPRSRRERQVFLQMELRQIIIWESAENGIWASACQMYSVCHEINWWVSIRWSRDGGAWPVLSSTDDREAV
jgi:hypothetical protein